MAEIHTWEVADTWSDSCRIFRVDFLPKKIIYTSRLVAYSLAMEKAESKKDGYGLFESTEDMMKALDVQARIGMHIAICSKQRTFLWNVCNFVLCFWVYRV